MVAQPVSQPRAAVYVRLATIGQQDSDRLAAQERACRRYATRRGYAVDEAHVYRDRAGGLRLDGRPGLAALRAAIRSGEVAAVIAESRDRLARDLTTFSGIAAACKQAGAALVFAQEGED